MSDNLDFPPWVSRPFIPPGYVSAGAAALLMIAIQREQMAGDWDGPIELVISSYPEYWQGEMGIEFDGKPNGPYISLFLPLSWAWTYMEEEYPTHSAVLFYSQLALNVFRVALVTEKLGLTLFVLQMEFLPRYQRHIGTLLRPILCSGMTALWSSCPETSGFVGTPSSRHQNSNSILLLGTSSPGAFDFATIRKSFSCAADQKPSSLSFRTPYHERATRS